MKKHKMFFLLMGLLLIVLTLQAAAPIQAAPAVDTYELSWFTLDGGGVINASSGEYSLSATIGQPDASSLMGGGEYTLTGGFWAGITLYQVYLPLVLR